MNQFTDYLKTLTEEQLETCIKEIYEFKKTGIIGDSLVRDIENKFIEITGHKNVLGITVVCSLITDFYAFKKVIYDKFIKIKGIIETKKERYK